jgi:hypothetical protein
MTDCCYCCWWPHCTRRESTAILQEQVRQNRVQKQALSRATIAKIAEITRRTRAQTEAKLAEAVSTPTYIQLANKHDAHLSLYPFGYHCLYIMIVLYAWGALIAG